jgi:alpha-D-xyloside xylohydrolase
VWCIFNPFGFFGQQRYGVINWSGDIGATGILRRQFVAGLNFTSLVAYWTTEIAVFSVGRFAIHRRENSTNCYPLVSMSVFNPIFRMHGYMTETEPWKYGEKVETNMRNMLTCGINCCLTFTPKHGK